MCTLQSIKNVLENSQQIEDAFGANLVHYAARAGNVCMLKFLVSNCGLNPLLRSETGSLPAHEAASCGKLEALRWLLEAGDTQLLDRDRFGHTFLHLAARLVNTHTHTHISFISFRSTTCCCCF